MKRITADAFAAAIAAARPVLVEFTAAWCPPCRALEPVLAALAVARKDVDVVALDVDEHPDVAATYGVRSMPTLIVFVAGRPVGQLVGARPRAQIEAWLDERVQPTRSV